MDPNYAKISKLTEEGTWEEVESSTDLLSSILCKLSVENIIICRAVSSYWDNVVRSPAFMEKQLRTSKEDPIYVVFPYVGWVMDIYLVDPDGQVLEAINVPGTDNLSFFRMNCSGNGLLCFTNCPYIPEFFFEYEDVTENVVDSLELDVHIFNPSTRKVFMVPRGTPSDECVQIGMAFGPTAGEYKVFRFFALKKGSGSGSGSEKPVEAVSYCEVFTPSSGEWRVIDTVPKIPLSSNSVFIDGKTHWFLPLDEDRSSPSSILVVDAEEHIWEIELPEDTDDFPFLTELNGRVCVVSVFYKNMSMKVWLLKYETNGYFWEDYCMSYLPYTPKDLTEAICGRKDDIFVITNSQYFLFDIKTLSWREIDYSEEFDINTPEVLPFTGSLVPCNGGVMGNDL